MYRSDMSMGIKPRVLMACLRYDVVKIIESIRAYSPQHVITFHDMFSDPSNQRMIFAERFQHILEDEFTNTSYHNFEMKQKDFRDISKTLELAVVFLNNLMNYPDIFINISAGTNEFAAAATMTSMIHENVTIFTQDEEEDNLTPDAIQKIYYKGGVPTGPVTKVSEPRAIDVYHVTPPSKPLILGLRILDENMKAGKSLMAKDMIKIFMDEGIWMRDGPSQNDNVLYLRDFVDKWIANGWVIRGQMRNQYRITEKGRMMLDTFYVHKNFFD